MIDLQSPTPFLALLDDFVAEGRSYFSHQEAAARLGKSPTATSNLLRRMVDAGLLDRVRRGHYVIRQLGVLGTRAAAESIAVAVAAAFDGHPHRIAFRSALDGNDLSFHPSRSIQVATTRRMRIDSLSGVPLQVILESDSTIHIGAVPHGPSFVSDVDRSLLEAAARPRLVGGAAVLAQALSAARDRIDGAHIEDLAQQLGASAALRRLGSIAEALDLAKLTEELSLPMSLKGDIDLEPGLDEPTVWRDSKWRVRWSQHPREIQNVILQ